MSLQNLFLSTFRFCLFSPLYEDNKANRLNVLTHSIPALKKLEPESAGFPSWLPNWGSKHHEYHQCKEFSPSFRAGASQRAGKYSISDDGSTLSIQGLCSDRIQHVHVHDITTYEWRAGQGGNPSVIISDRWQRWIDLACSVGLLREEEFWRTMVFNYNNANFQSPINLAYRRSYLANCGGIRSTAGGGPR
jgi:hypothetical protein